MTQKRPFIFGIILLGMFAYQRLISLEAFHLDDPVHLERNEKMDPVTFGNILSFWKEPYEDAFMPVPYTIWSLVAIFARDSNHVPFRGVDGLQRGQKFFAVYFHRVNLALHLLGSVLVFLVLAKLVNHLSAAFLGALLFTLHPVQVEPVAWITGMRGLLINIFAMLTFLSYWKFCESSQKRNWYWISFVCFLLATLCKPTGYSVLLMVALMAVTLRGKTPRAVIKELLPWGLISAVFIPIHLSLNSGVVEKAVPFYPKFERIFIVLDSLFFYVGKVLLPIHLVVDYGKTPLNLFQSSSIYASSAAILALGFCLYRFRHVWWGRVACIGFAFMVVALLPMLGFTPFIFQHISTVSDRYLYLAMFGPAFIVASLISRIRSQWFMGCMVGLIALLTLRTWFQVKVWDSQLSLFENNVRATPQSWLANNNVGNAHERLGNLEKALYYYKEASKYANFPAIWNNIGAVSLRLGKHQEAIFSFSKVLKLSPNSPEAHNNLGVVWARLGQDKIARRHFELAMKFDPDMVDPLKNLKKLN